MVEHLTEEPADEPVSVEEAKAQITLETSEDQALLELMISAARRHVESHCNRGIVQQKWEAVLDAFPHYGHPLYQQHSCLPFGFGGYGAGYGYGIGGRPCRACKLFIELPHGQLATLEDDDPAVESIKYIDTAGSEITLATSEYSVDAVSVPGRVHLAYGKSWPSARSQWDAVKVVYSVGWAVDVVPEPIKQAILLLVSQMYENRVPEVERALTPIEFSFGALLAPYRIISL
jgi:hypothetical protein